MGSTQRLIIMLGGTFLVAVLGMAIEARLRAAVRGPFAIATTPPGARVILDQVEIGSSPISPELGLGTHVVEVRKPGYLSVSRAFHLRLSTKEDPAKEEWAMNIALEPEPKQSASGSGEGGGTDSSAASLERMREYQAALATVQADLAKMNEWMFSSAEDKFTAGQLKVKVSALEDRVKYLQEQFNTLFISVIGLIAAIVAAAGISSFRK